MVNVGVFYDHFEYFMAIWYNLWPFGIVYGHLLHFSRFGMFGTRKIWQPCCLWQTHMVKGRTHKQTGTMHKSGKSYRHVPNIFAKEQKALKGI
jgi:hypothetical protein